MTLTKKNAQEYKPTNILQKLAFQNKVDCMVYKGKKKITTT
jgi:hypothetical protein